jgi:hypothetical protein
MRTSVKVILAAVSSAVLASSVMAQNWRNPDAPLLPDLSTDNVFWGEVYAHPHPFAYGSAAPAYGSAAPAPAGRFAPGVTGPGVTVSGHPRIIDCVHVTFPQCSGGGGGN